VIEQHSSQNHSVNSSDTNERSQYQQTTKNATQLQRKTLKEAKEWVHDELYHSQTTGNKQYSETSSNKLQNTSNQEGEGSRREVEPLADKLLYLTNQACQSKIKSKSLLTQSMKSSGALRKAIKSPSGSQSTLQEPSAKAMPTSSKVKISQKFNKFEQSNPAMKVPGYSTKQNLFQTKTMKKQGSGMIDFKESFKSPDARTGTLKKTGSISYAILPRQVIPGTDLKATKKMKSPSPSSKQGPD